MVGKVRLGRFIGRKPQSVTAAPPYNPPDAHPTKFSAKLSSSFDEHRFHFETDLSNVHVNITIILALLCEM